MKTNHSLVWYFGLQTTVVALVPHQFWNRSPQTCTSRRYVRDNSMSMYFDDCERSKEIEERFRTNPIYDTTNQPWIISFSDEKQKALQEFLGYNPVSVSKLSEEEIEEETLCWVVNTEIVSVGDDERKFVQELEYEDDFNVGFVDSGQRTTNVQYDSIADVLVASSCASASESLAFLWSQIAEELEHPTVSKSAKLIVFPRAESLWQYDTMVTMLESIQIAKPLLPNNLDLQLDLFHPDFKHSPRMWSPQWHSPFPTVGIVVKSKKEESIDNINVDTMRSKLDVIFQSIDATREDNQQQPDDDPAQILNDCKSWFRTEIEDTDDDNSIDWAVQNLGCSPYRLYTSLWNAIAKLSSENKSASVVIDPNLDSRTLYRVAITVNAALMKLDIPIRITELYHPFAQSRSSNSRCKNRPPYGMIKLSLMTEP